MIYVFRHQKGYVYTNCLSEIGIQHSYQIANKIKHHDSLYIYTSLPKYNGKHVRPVQTASLICSKLNLSLSFIDDYDFPSNQDDDNTTHVIIWHHNDIPKILNKYFPNNSFIWYDNNYSGCLIIDKDRWTFYPSFLTKSHWKLFKHKINKIIKYVTHMSFPFMSTSTRMSIPK